MGLQVNELEDGYVRKIARIFLMGLALLPAGFVHALGLGEIQLRSGLNQPLDAEIELLSVRPGETEGMIVSLAPQEAFLRAGVERPFMLRQLRFEVVQTPDGQPIIQVTTRRPIVEPFLNFLVEVDWPRGRLLKEYTVLLDPPVFMTDMASAGTPEAPVAGGGDQVGAAVPGAIVRAEPEPAFLASEPAQPAEPMPAPMAEPMPAPMAEPMPAPMAEPMPAPVSAEPMAAVTELPPPLDDESDESSLEPEPLRPEPVPLGDSDELWPRVDVGQSYDVAQLPANARIAAPAAGQPPAPVFTGDTYGPVAAGEALWGIANRTRPTAASVNQMMLALLQYNPEAFFDDNINNLKRGVVLRIPAEADVLALTRGEANAQVTAQNALWEQVRQRSVAAAPAMAEEPSAEPTEAPVSEAVVSTPADDSSLALVADDQGSETAASVATTTPATTGAAGDLANRELALAQEELAAERLQNQELRDRVSELENIIANVESLISLRESEVAELQARLRSLEEAAAAPSMAEPAVPVPAPETTAAETQPTTQLEPAPVTPPMAEPEPQPSVAEEIGAVTPPSVEPAPATVAPVEPARVEPTPTPMPATLPPVTPRKSFVDQLLDDLMGGRILDNPVLMAIIGGVVSLLLVVWLVIRRRSTSEEAVEVDVESLPDQDELADGGMTVEAVIDETLDEEDLAAPLVDALDEELEEEPLGATATGLQDTVNLGDLPQEDDGPKDDTIAEADVYLAYGLYSQSEDLLKQALAEHPDRHEYHEKLLETYFAANNKEAFETQAGTFHGLLAGKPSRLWDRVVAMGGELCPENPLFSGAADLDISAQELHPAKPETPDLELDSEDLTPDLDFGIDEEETYVNTGTDFDTGEIPLVADETIHDDDELDATHLLAETPTMEMDELTKGDTADHMDLDTAEVEKLSGESETVALDGDMEFDITSSDLDELGTPTDAFPSTPDVPPAAGADEEEEGLLLTSGEHPAVSGTAEYDMSKLTEAVPDATDIIDNDAGKRHPDATDQVPAAQAAGAGEPEPTFDDVDFDDEPGPDYNMGGTAEIPVMDDVDDFELDLDVDEGGQEEDEPSVVSQLVTSVSEELDNDDDDEPQLVSEIMPSITDDMLDKTVVQDSDSFTGDAAMVDDGDEVETMLDLAKAYLDMGDSDSATSALEEIMAAGNDRQKREAQDLLQKIS